MASGPPRLAHRSHIAACDTPQITLRGSAAIMKRLPSWAMGRYVDQVAEDVVAGQRGVTWLVTVAVDGDCGLQAVDPRGEGRAGELQGDRTACHGGAAGRGEGMALAVGQGAGGDLNGVIYVAGSETRGDPIYVAGSEARGGPIRVAGGETRADLERQAHRRRLSGDP